MKCDFEGERRFLSNFYESKIVIDGKEYRTVEHYFQAMKATNEEDHELVRNVLRANTAKSKGRQIKLRSDWDEVKDEIMEKGVRAKFEQNHELKRLLIQTAPDILEEGNTWHDTEWGVDYYTRKGQNKLGKILMKLRDEFLEEFKNKWFS
jgi:hypothetical protein